VPKTMSMIVKQNVAGSTTPFLRLFLPPDDASLNGNVAASVRCCQCRHSVSVLLWSRE
jgi:hypothetical protein